MKAIEQVRTEFICPNCKDKEGISFKGETAHCNKCNSDFDLGMKKYK